FWKGNGVDETKVPNWGKLFEAPRRTPAQSGHAFAEFMDAAKRYGIRASGLSVSKIVRDDSVSEITYQLRDLVVVRGTLKGVKFHYESSLGLTGPPELDADAVALGIQWQPQAPRPARQAGKSTYEKSLSTIRDQARRLDGTFMFSSLRRRKD